MADTTETSTVYATVSLTTIFTTPSFCASRSYTVSEEHIVTLGVTRPMRDCVSSTWTQCAPTEVSFMWCNFRDRDQAAVTQYTQYWNIVSPGVCPADQTVVETSVLTFDDETTTLAGCCPT